MAEGDHSLDELQCSLKNFSLGDNEDYRTSSTPVKDRGPGPTGKHSFTPNFKIANEPNRQRSSEEVDSGVSSEDATGLLGKPGVTDLLEGSSGNNISTMETKLQAKSNNECYPETMDELIERIKTLEEALEVEKAEKIQCMAKNKSLQIMLEEKKAACQKLRQHVRQLVMDHQAEKNNNQHLLQMAEEELETLKRDLQAKDRELKSLREQRKEDQEDPPKEQQKCFGIALIEGIIGDKTVSLLVDTGASCSIIAKKNVGQFLSQISESSIPCVEAPDGTKMEISGRLSVPLVLNNHECTCDFYVMEDCRWDGILGFDYLLKYGAVIDFRKHTLSLKTTGNLVFTCNLVYRMYTGVMGSFLFLENFKDMRKLITPLI